jgi:hypothetical protein
VLVQSFMILRLPNAGFLPFAQQPTLAGPVPKAGTQTGPLNTAICQYVLSGRLLSRIQMVSGRRNEIMSIGQRRTARVDSCDVILAESNRLCGAMIWSANAELSRL